MAGRAASFVLLVACLGCDRAPAPPPAKPADAHGRIQVGSILVGQELVRSVRAVRPKNATGQVVAGRVIVRATISKTGAVIDAEVAEGNPELAPAALAAVRQWRYKPVVLNGEPVEVITEIDVPFKND